MLSYAVEHMGRGPWVSVLYTFQYCWETVKKCSTHVLPTPSQQVLGASVYTK